MGSTISIMVGQAPRGGAQQTLDEDTYIVIPIILELKFHIITKLIERINNTVINILDQIIMCLILA